MKNEMSMDPTQAMIDGFAAGLDADSLEAEELLAELVQEDDLLDAVLRTRDAHYDELKANQTQELAWRNAHYTSGRQLGKEIREQAAR